MFTILKFSFGYQWHSIARGRKLQWQNVEKAERGEEQGDVSRTTADGDDDAQSDSLVKDGTKT